MLPGHWAWMLLLGLSLQLVGIGNALAQSGGDGAYDLWQRDLPELPNGDAFYTSTTAHRNDAGTSPALSGDFPLDNGPPTFSGVVNTGSALSMIDLDNDSGQFQTIQGYLALPCDAQSIRLRVGAPNTYEQFNTLHLATSGSLLTRDAADLSQVSYRKVGYQRQFIGVNTIYTVAATNFGKWVRFAIATSDGGDNYGVSMEWSIDGAAFTAVPLSQISSLQSEPALQDCRAQVVVAKSSNPGTGVFTFSGSNGVGAFSLDTTTSNPATSATFEVTSPGDAITITESVAASFELREASCVDQDGAAIPATLSAQTLTIAGPSYGDNDIITCTFVNSSLPVLRLEKQLPSGRFAESDQFLLSIQGSTGSDSTTTTGAGSVASGLATLGPATAGETYTFSESAAGATDAGNYTSTYACTNAEPTGTADFSGSGVTFTVTPQANDDLTCIFINQRAVVNDLNIIKRAASETISPGESLSFMLEVSNVGLDPVSNAVVTDQPDAALVCPGAGNPNEVICSGDACNGPYTVDALLGAGLTLGTLNADETVTLTYSCLLP
ncbi:prealbumin-like fold domain-containing protein [Pseudoxanthomonas dokdonensis]|nr:DUF11 domain-containing protein [Pseudoxanthomonas dokdonensis]